MLYQFADCVLDEQAFALIKAGSVQSVEPQVFDLLVFFVQNAGRLITRDQLIDAVWSGRIVSESAISARISAARNAVGDDGKRQSIIRTVPRRGFQFVATLSTEPSPQKDTTSREIANPVRPSSTHRPKIRFATANDGVKIAYAVSGSGPPLVHVSHHPTHLELDWEEPTERAWCDRLGETHTLIKLDQRGCGLSDLDVEDFSTERSAKDVRAVADELGLDHFALLGNSSGVMIAVEFAARYPDLVSQMVLIGGYVDGRSVRESGTASDDHEVILKMVKAGWGTPDSAFVSGYLSVYMPTATPEQLQHIAHNLQNSCPIENEIAGRQFYNQHSIANLLGNVKTPTLVMHSKGDEVHPISQGQKLAKGIANAQLVVLDSRNHFPLPQEKSWIAMCDIVEEFLTA